METQAADNYKVRLGESKTVEKHRIIVQTDWKVKGFKFASLPECVTDKSLM